MGIFDRRHARQVRAAAFPVRFETLEPRLLLSATPEADISYIQKPYHGTPAMYDFEMFYQDDVAIDASTLGNADIRVLGPGYDQMATFLGVHPIADPRYVRAVYRVNAPGGLWNNADNGAYTFILQPNQVADNAGHFVTTKVLKTTLVDIALPEGDISYIQKDYHGTPLPYAFEMRYQGDLPIDTSTLGSTDIRVQGPNGVDTTATFLGIHPIVDARDIRAVYVIAAPGGAWDPSDNGAYTLTLRSGEVSDTAGDAALTKVLKVVTVDVQRPEAKMTYVPASYNGSYSPFQFEVRYWGDLPIDTTTIDSSDLRIVGPGGYDTSATFVGLMPVTDPTKVFAVYSAPVPAGGWNSNANGTYTVSLNSNQVADTSGSFAFAKTLDTFKVGIDRLEADISYIQPTWKGTPATLDFEVTFTADLGVDTTTIDSSDLSVVGPNGYNQTATLLGLHPVVDPNEVRAVYRIAAPGGAWDVGDNGTYTISLRASEVFDLAGIAGLPVALDTTRVDVPRPEGHMSYIQDPYHANPGTLYFEVRYEGDTPIDTTTIGAGDVRVIGPGTNTLATFVGLHPVVNPNEVRAVYSLPAPGGAWDPADNGAYSFLLVAGQIADTGGATALAKTLETITVDIVGPEAKLTYIQPTYAGTPATLDFEMRYWGDRAIDTTTIGALDIRILGPGVDTYATFVGLHPVVDPTKVYAIYRIEPPGGTWDAADNGTYTLLIEPNRVFDVLGIAVIPKTLGTMSVDI